MYSDFNEKRLRRLSEEIEIIRAKIHRMFNSNFCLSDPEVRELSRKLDSAIIRYQEYSKRLT